LKEKLIHTTIEQLEKQTNLQVSFTDSGNPSAQSGIDGYLELKNDNQTVRYCVVIKQEIRNHQLNTLRLLSAEFDPMIVIAKRLFPKIKDALREMNIGYIEENGNCFIQNQNLFIFIDANKTNEEKETVNRALTKTGLKVIFQYLLNPDRVNATYREIAENADVAVGNITYVKNGLKELGFLATLNNKRERLINLQNLFEVWIDAYGKTLKPTLHLGNFRFIDNVPHNYWKTLDLEDERTVWGGEPAAHTIDKYLEPETLTIYTEDHLRNLMKKYRIAPSPKGEIEIYKKFWKNTENSIIAPPILTYADLVNTGNARCMEAADRLYKEYIHEHLQRFS
jgi:hypothetical protein